MVSLSLVIRPFCFYLSLLLLFLALCCSTLWKSIRGECQRIFANLCEIFETGELVVIDVVFLYCRLEILIFLFIFVCSDGSESVWVFIYQVS